MLHPIDSEMQAESRSEKVKNWRKVHRLLWRSICLPHRHQVIAKKKKGARNHPSPLCQPKQIYEKNCCGSVPPFGLYGSALDVQSSVNGAEVGATPTDATCHKVVHNVS